MTTAYILTHAAGEDTIPMWAIYAKLNGVEAKLFTDEDAFKAALDMQLPDYLIVEGNFKQDKDHKKEATYALNFLTYETAGKSIEALINDGQIKRMTVFSYTSECLDHFRADEKVKPYLDKKQMDTVDKHILHTYIQDNIKPVA
jgi:hypothetical protein